jgi:hypothetical protein
MSFLGKFVWWQGKDCVVKINGLIYSIDHGNTLEKQKTLPLKASIAFLSNLIWTR